MLYLGAGQAKGCRLLVAPRASKYGLRATVHCTIGTDQLSYNNYTETEHSANKLACSWDEGTHASDPLNDCHAESTSWHIMANAIHTSASIGVP